MNAKQWLGRARFIDRELKALKREKQKTLDDLTKITQSYESDGAQMTKDPHKFDRIAEYTGLIEQKEAELMDTKKQILETIMKLQDGKQRSVLFEYYIEGKKWEEVAVDLHYSYMHVTRIHGYALTEVQKML